MKRIPIALLAMLLAAGSARAQSPGEDEDDSDDTQAVQPPTAAPDQAPPAPPLQPPARPAASAEATSHQIASAPPQNQASGQWVYTSQYGWVWMPYGSQYVDEGTYGDDSPYQYVYVTDVGWSWFAAPWLWGWGPYPYFGVWGPWHFGWYRGLYHHGYGWGGYRGGSYRGGGIRGGGYRGGVARGVVHGTARGGAVGHGAARGVTSHGGGGFRRIPRGRRLARRRRPRRRTPLTRAAAGSGSPLSGAPAGVAMQTRIIQGVAVPAFLYGTAWKEERTEALTAQALAAGFRGIDTANQRRHYVEAAVGDAVAAAISAGRLQRDDLFLQSKFTHPRGQDHRLPYDRAAPPAEQVRQSFASSLAHLRTDRLDAYLLHGPSRADRLSEEDWEVWSAMTALVREGRVRLIGISNVTAAQLEELIAGSPVKPALVQNRCYASQGWDAEVRALCSAHGLGYQGFSLLTANRRELARPAFGRAAARSGRTREQVAFRLALQLGIIPLTGSSDPQHLREDLRGLRVRARARRAGGARGACAGVEAARAQGRFPRGKRVETRAGGGPPRTCLCGEKVVTVLPGGCRPTARA